MKTLQETNLFKLLTETSKAGHSDVNFLSDVNIACNEFADQLSEYCVTQSNDAAFTFRALSYASINLESLQAEIACLEMEKNVLINLQLSRTVRLIKVEIEMLTFAIQNSDTMLKFEKMDKSSVKQADTLWTGTIIEFVELFYGTLELAKFNKGDIKTKELIDSLCVKFGFEVKDCYGAYLDMRKRTGKSRTLFLYRMSKALNERMERDDEREHSRTKGK